MNKKIMAMGCMLIAGGAVYPQDVEQEQISSASQQTEKTGKMDEDTLRLVLECLKDLQQAMKDMEELNVKIAAIEQDRHNQH